MADDILVDFPNATALNAAARDAINKAEPGVCWFRPTGKPANPIEGDCWYENNDIMLWHENKAQLFRDVIGAPTIPPFVKVVPTLPETGEENFLYVEPITSDDPELPAHARLFVWADENNDNQLEWVLIGSFQPLPDLTAYATKTYVDNKIPAIDSVPTEGSSNLVTSGGVYTAIQQGGGGTAIDTTYQWANVWDGAAGTWDVNDANPVVPSNLKSMDRYARFDGATRDITKAVAIMFLYRDMSNQDPCYSSVFPATNIRPSWQTLPYNPENASVYTNVYMLRGTTGNGIVKFTTPNRLTFLSVNGIELLGLFFLMPYENLTGGGTGSSIDMSAVTELINSGDATTLDTAKIYADTQDQIITSQLTSALTTALNNYYDKSQTYTQAQVNAYVAAQEANDLTPEQVQAIVNAALENFPDLPNNIVTYDSATKHFLVGSTIVLDLNSYYTKAEVDAKINELSDFTRAFSVSNGIPQVSYQFNGDITAKYYFYMYTTDRDTGSWITGVYLTNSGKTQYNIPLTDATIVEGFNFRGYNTQDYTTLAKFVDQLLADEIAGFYRHQLDYVPIDTWQEADTNNPKLSYNIPLGTPRTELESNWNTTFVDDSPTPKGWLIPSSGQIMTFITNNTETTVDGVLGVTMGGDLFFPYTGSLDGDGVFATRTRIWCSQAQSLGPVNCYILATTDDPTWQERSFNIYAPVRCIRLASTTDYEPCPAGEYQVGDIIIARSNLAEPGKFCAKATDFGMYYLWGTKSYLTGPYPNVFTVANKEQVDRIDDTLSFVSQSTNSLQQDLNTRYQMQARQINWTSGLTLSYWFKGDTRNKVYPLSSVGNNALTMQIVYSDLSNQTMYTASVLQQDLDALGTSQAVNINFGTQPTATVGTLIWQETFRPSFAKAVDLTAHVTHDAELYQAILLAAREEAQLIYDGTTPQLSTTGTSIVGTSGILTVGGGGQYTCPSNGGITITFSAVLALGNAQVLVNGASVFDSSALSLLAVPKPTTVRVNGGDIITTSGSLGVLSSLSVMFYPNA